MSAEDTRVAVRLHAHQAYQCWAAFYDSTPNALLALEERCLAPVVLNWFDEDIVDVKQIDKVLSELGAMSGRWNLFRKFLFDRLSVI